jgi:probable DNA repair protein
MHRDLPRWEKAELLARLAAGHEARITVVTPNRRLAQFLREEFDASRIAAGLNAWESADILPLGALVERMWEEALFSELAAEMPVLLSPAQEGALWHQAVAAHRPPERGLFSAEAAAAQCAQAWQLANAWRLELKPDAQWNEDARAFLAWAGEYRRATRERVLTDHARLPDVVIPHVGHAALRRPQALVLYGFDLLTPQARDFAEALKAAGTSIVAVDPAPRQAQVRRVACVDARHEIVSAAGWARSRLERPRAPGAAPPRIGVVVPDLSRDRSRVERLFADVLHPDHAIAPPAAMAFELSLGKPLAEYPLVADALRILRLAGRQVGFEEASRVVRSPFIAGAESERDARARADSRLRERSPSVISLERLARQCASPRSAPVPGLVASLEALARSCAPLREAKRSAAEWSRAFSQLLAATGFPGERGLDSAEHQALERWHELLAEFATLERVAAPVGCDRACELIAAMARDTVFQPEGHAAPIRILGILESAGLEFDHLWVMGLTDDAWPLPARPNPFLPAALQRKVGIPQADPVSSLDLDRRITEGWLRSAEEVVVSHAQMRKEAELAASPLVASIAEVALEDLGIAAPRLMRAGVTAQLESVADANGPAPGSTAPGGGTRLFGDQAACPFRGYAAFRLHSKPVETPRPGLDARARGTLLHCMLAAVWREIGDSGRLAALSARELDAVLQRAADEAFAQQRPRTDALEGRFGELEHARLIRIAREWLALERRRDAFEVAAIEEKQELTFGGVTVQVRLDRVDRLARGTHVVLDYKTGACAVRDWLGPRPEAPQLPMYALGARAADAIAFARVRTGGMAFIGLAREAGILPDVEAVEKDRNAKKMNIATWNGLLAGLRRELDAVGAGYLAGDARVDPKRGKQTCAHCDHRVACRVAEKASFGAVGGDDADD